MTKPQEAGMKALATVEFTLHVHCSDGTTKDLKCVGVAHSDPVKDQKEIPNGNHGT